MGNEGKQTTSTPKDIKKSDLVGNVLAIGSARTKECIAIYEGFKDSLSVLVQTPSHGGPISDNPLVNTALQRLVESLLFRDLNFQKSEDMNRLVMRLEGVDLGIRIGSLLAYHTQVSRSGGSSGDQSIPGEFTNIAGQELKNYVKRKEKQLYRSLEALEHISPTLSDADRWRLRVTTYLKQEHGNMAINPRRLGDLDDSLKKEARRYVRYCRGEGPQTENLIKELFRRPKSI